MVIFSANRKGEWTRKKVSTNHHSLPNVNVCLCIFLSRNCKMIVRNISRCKRHECHPIPIDHVCRVSGRFLGRFITGSVTSARKPQFLTHLGTEGLLQKHKQQIKPSCDHIDFVVALITGSFTSTCKSQIPHTSGHKEIVEKQTTKITVFKVTFREKKGF